MSENHDPGDENNRIYFHERCPHCSKHFMRGTGYVTPVLKPVNHVDYARADPTEEDSPVEDLLYCCGHAQCLVKDRELARKLAEDLDYKLDRRRYDLMIKEAKERNAGL